MRHACSTVAIAVVGVLSWPGERRTQTTFDVTEKIPELTPALVR